MTLRHLAQNVVVVRVTVAFGWIATMALFALILVGKDL
jgi:hypothetical protein